MECAWVGKIANGEARELGGPVDQELTQCEHHELRWIVSDIDYQTLALRGSLDIARGVGRLHLRKLQIRHVSRKQLECVAGTVVGGGSLGVDLAGHHACRRQIEWSASAPYP